MSLMIDQYREPIQKGMGHHRTARRRDPHIRLGRAGRKTHFDRRTSHGK